MLLTVRSTRCLLISCRRRTSVVSRLTFSPTVTTLQKYSLCYILISAIMKFLLYMALVYAVATAKPMDDETEMPNKSSPVPVLLSDEILSNNYRVERADQMDASESGEKKQKANSNVEPKPVENKPK